MLAAFGAGTRRRLLALQEEGSPHPGPSPNERGRMADEDGHLHADILGAFARFPAETRIQKTEVAAKEGRGASRAPTQSVGARRRPKDGQLHAEILAMLGALAAFADRARRRLLAAQEEGSPRPGPLPAGEGEGRTKMVNFVRTSWAPWPGLRLKRGFRRPKLKTKKDAERRRAGAHAERWRQTANSKMVSFRRTSWPPWPPLATGLVEDCLPKKGRQPSPRPSPSGRGRMAAKMVNFVRAPWPCWPPLAERFLDAWKYVF